MPLKPGTRLGPYEIRAQIGAGGMGEVYQGWDTRLDRLVAIKILPAHLADRPEDPPPGCLQASQLRAALWRSDRARQD